MLSDAWVVLLRFQFLGMKSPVFGRGVVVPRSGRGHESDFLSHLRVPSLNLFAALAEILNDLLYAEFIDNAQALPRDFELNEALLVLQPKTLGVEVGQEPSTCPVQGVGNIVSRHRAFPGNLANSGHFGR